MANIILRKNKNSALTFDEADSNFSELDKRTKSGWFDLTSSLYTRPGGNNPGYVQWKSRIYRPEFVQGMGHEMFADFHINHDYQLNTMLYPHFHFLTKSNATGTVTMNFEYSFAKRYDSDSSFKFTDPVTLSRSMIVPANSADKHFVLEVAEGAGIPGDYIEPDVIIMLSVWRDINDTFPASILGIQCDLHYQRNRDSTPRRSPNFYLGD